MSLAGESGGEDAHDTQTAGEEPKEKVEKEVEKKRKLKTQEPHKAKKKKTVQVTHTDGNYLFSVSEMH